MNFLADERITVLNLFGLAAQHSARCAIRKKFHRNWNKLKGKREFNGRGFLIVRRMSRNGLQQNTNREHEQRNQPLSKSSREVASRCRHSDASTYLIYSFRVGVNLEASLADAIPGVKILYYRHKCYILLYD